MEHATCLPAQAPRPRLAQILARALALHRSRRGLTQLDPHMLRDIGLTEAARPLWDAPEHWMKG